VNEDIKKVCGNEKGFTTVEIITYIAIAAIIASIAIPQYSDAFRIRSERISNNFESTDTLIGE